MLDRTTLGWTFYSISMKVLEFLKPFSKGFKRSARQSLATLMKLTQFVRHNQIFEGVDQENTVGRIEGDEGGNVCKILTGGGKVEQNQVKMLGEEGGERVGKAILEQKKCGARNAVFSGNCNHVMRSVQKDRVVILPV